jgi:hypothetical protein
MTHRSCLWTLNGLVHVGVTPPGPLAIMCIYALLPVMRMLEGTHDDLQQGIVSSKQITHIRTAALASDS